MNAGSTVLHGRPLVGGAAAGELLVASAPLSFWGGYDYATGEITDRRHPLSGQIAVGRILALPYTIGSSTTTAVLSRPCAGTAPAAILTASADVPGPRRHRGRCPLCQAAAGGGNRRRGVRRPARWPVGRADPGGYVFLTPGDSGGN